MNATLRGAQSCALARALGNITVTTTARASPHPWTCPSCRSKPPPSSSVRSASSSSSSQWKSRQSRDHYARDAKTAGLKSRAAFKLLELNAKFRLFKSNQAVVDLGYAPGSWSQVALERTKPHGVVVGIDLIPAMPPRGVTAIQGNFLNPQVRKLVRQVVVEQVNRRRKAMTLERRFEDIMLERDSKEGEKGEGESGVLQDRPSYIDREKLAAQGNEAAETARGEKMVDVVISDMSEPWPQTAGFTSNTLSNPYRRLMNTSGMAFRDHAGSMDLCYAALAFASENLKPNGHFVCKFYQGAEDKLLQTKIQKMFESVHREKPDASRKDSKESYLIGLRRRADVTLASIEGTAPNLVKS